jgi:hypothetical protein
MFFWTFVHLCEQKILLILGASDNFYIGKLRSLLLFNKSLKGLAMCLTEVMFLLIEFAFLACLKKQMCMKGMHSNMNGKNSCR